MKEIRKYIKKLFDIKGYVNKKSNIYSKHMNFYEIVFTYSEYKSLEKRCFLYNIADENLFCIFCLNNEPLSIFKDDAHVIPYLLGNKFLMHRQECEECNKRFGKTLETELANFSEKFRVINGHKNRSKKNPDYLKYQAKSQKAFLQMKNIDNKMQLEVTGERFKDILKEHESEKISLTFETVYRDSDVYKAFMKTIYGVIPPKYRKDFSQLRSWINTEDHNIKFLNKLIMYQTILPTTHQDNLIINIHRKKKNFTNLLFKSNYFEYFALIGFGNVFFDIPLLSDHTIKKIQNNSQKSTFIFPIFSELVVNDKGAFRTTLDMSSTERRSEKISFFLAGE